MSPSASARRPAGLGEPRRGRAGEHPPAGVHRPELAPQAVGLFQVVGEQLRVLAQPLAGGPLQPAGEALVQLGAERLGQAGVGGVAEQRVAEAERLLAGDVRGRRADQLPAHQRAQVAADRLRVGAGRQLGHRVPVERLADHAGPADHGALLLVELLHARGE
jgi:hypothetical protein